LSGAQVRPRHSVPTGFRGLYLQASPEGATRKHKHMILLPPYALAMRPRAEDARFNSQSR